MKKNKDNANIPKSLEGITVGQLTKGFNDEGKPLTKQQKANLGDCLFNFFKPYAERLKRHSIDIRMFADYCDECKTKAEEIFSYFNSELNIIDFDEKFQIIQNDKPMDVYTLSYLAKLIEEKGISEAAAKRTKDISISSQKSRANDPRGLAKIEISKIYAERKSQFKRYGYTAEFTREMHEKFPEIKSIKTIEKLVAKLNKENNLIPL